MRKFWQNNRIIQEDNEELENQPTKLQQSLAELDCENTIIKDKERFGRARNSMMKVLRAKYGYKIPDKALNRVNKRIQIGHLKF